MAREIERAQHACPNARFIAGDIRTTGFGSADAVVILDVLHYIDYEAQAEVLRRMRTALGRGSTASRSRSGRASSRRSAFR